VKKTIMIGDPQQLPATVFSTMATQFLYERSLFARFTASMNAENVLLLNTQYRMHPQISLFPNHHFYKGLLVDGVANSVAPWCSTPIGSELFSPLRFFDLAHSKVNPGAKSLSNDEEVAFIVGMIHKLMASNPSVSFLDKIVVITPYQLQRSRLKIAFEREAQVHGLFRTIDACTVDSYQGKEKEIVIFSTVRAKRGQTIGFLADVRRMNVALTRAKQSLWIIGHSATLQINSEWKALLKSIDDRELRSTVDQSAQDWWSGK
jgi:senataxin